MAYLQTVGKSTRVLFVDWDGKRRQLGLGRIDRNAATQIAVHLEELARSREQGRDASPAAMAWLKLVSPRFRARLDGLGLFRPDPPPPLGVDGLVIDWCTKRAGALAVSTSMSLANSQSFLIAFLGRNKPVVDVTEADAADYRAWLLKRGLGEATVRKRCAHARMWFRHALHQRLIDRNPFGEVATASIPSECDEYIPEDLARKVMGNIWCWDVRLIFVFARWGGLRIPSEVENLALTDFDFEKKIFRVDGKTGKRDIPMFPEIQKAMEGRRFRSDAGWLLFPSLHDKYAINPVYGSPASLRKPLEKACWRSLVKPWGRLWHSLRASRQTDLEKVFPRHVVCTWLGNSSAVAQRHYLRVTPDDFTKAVQE